MTADESSLEDARRSLYAGPRSTFVERRKELAGAARSGGDRDQAKLIGQMRKPAAAAHLVNLLAQADDESLTELVELGASIRAAMAAGDDREMRSLLTGRAPALSKAMAHARKIAKANGESVSGAVGDEVMQTLRAAMASDDGSAAVRSGTLTDPLDEPGFGGFSIDLATKPATTVTTVTRAKPPKRPRNVAAQTESAPDADLAAERAAERAAAQVRIRLARADVKLAERTLTATTKQRDGLQRDRERLVAQLEQVDVDLAAAQSGVDDAQRQLGDATAELDAANDSVG